MDRLSPTLRPDGRPVGFQRWRSLLFLHWEVPVAVLTALLPPQLTVDTFEGRAYVGLVPFTMRDVRPWWSPSVPGVSNFHELNLRTYVHVAGRQPGVWFFSLDAKSSLAVVLARSSWSLPYYRAAIDLTAEGDEVRYTSRRLWPGPKPAELSLHYRLGDDIGVAAAGTLEHFLVERYVLYAMTPFGLASGRVHHRPYPLRRAQVLALRESVVMASGLPTPRGAPHVLASAGVDVDIFALARLD
jgi:uncharacterized protein YqjF (DUF2071 family)